MGSPTAAEIREWNIETNYFDSRANTMRLGVTNKGRDQKLIVMAASINGHAEAEATYRRLLDDHEELLRDSAKYYEDYLQRDGERFAAGHAVAAGVRLVTGERGARDGEQSVSRHGVDCGISHFGRERAARICMVFRQGFDVDGVGAECRRRFRGYADSDGIRRQVSARRRENSARDLAGGEFVDWFKKFPYAYASADATPLYIIAMNDYVVQSGDRSSRRKSGTACGRRMNSCARLTMRKDFRRISGSVTDGLKGARCCR